MRTLSSPTIAALAAGLTQPGYLVAIDWSTPAYLSSRGTVSWNGQTWAAIGVVVNGLTWGSSVEQSGSIVIPNADLAWGAVALNEGVADVRVRIWIYDAAATAAADPVPVFDGAGDTCTITPEKVDVKFTNKLNRSLFSPRSYITSYEGFSIVPPDGRIVDWGGQRFVLQRQR